MSSEGKMTWREKTVIKILLIIARIICQDDKISEEIKQLANHISAEFLD